MLGEGSFGKVYKCMNKVTGHRMAIKLVSKASLTENILVNLMMQELEIVAQINHPNIIRIYELIEDDCYFYTVSEIVSGGELADKAFERDVMACMP